MTLCDAFVLFGSRHIILQKAEKFYSIESYYTGNKCSSAKEIHCLPQK